MSGDLEDFLRRAAQRRQAKAAQQQQPQPTPRPRPQYSDSRTERRVVQQHDEILTAEVVEEDPNSLSARRRRLEQAKQAAAKAEAEAAEQLKKVAAAGPKTPVAAMKLSGNPAADLLKLLRQPGGIQQAILLREIFDRPEHRW